MTSIDFAPLYRNTIGFDRMFNLLDNAMKSENVSAGYPPYNIEVVAENKYAITLAVAGFAEEDIHIQVNQGVLTVTGRKAKDEQAKQYLHQGIANRAFERKFNLADHIEVTSASLENGLLTVGLVKEIPEAMKPRTIQVNGRQPREALESQKSDSVEQVQVTQPDRAA